MPMAIVMLAMYFPMAVQSANDEPGFWSIQLENDLWGSSDDRFYTNGWEFSYVSPNPPPKLLQQITDWLPFYDKGETVYYGYNIGQKIFTPEDTTKVSLIINDRPYAGWLYYETIIGHRYMDRGDRELMNGLFLTLGVVGPAPLAEESQKLIHEIVNSPDPKGWDNQLDNELGLNATFLQKWRRIHNFDERWQSEVSLHTGLTLGNVYSYASAGIMMRWGTHLKDDIGPPTISPGFPGFPAFNSNRQDNWYFFIGFETRAVARNIFLDGNTDGDSHSVDKKNLIGDLPLGIAFHFNDMRVSFSQMYRSKEFEGQSEPTRYGAINFTVFVD